MTKRYLEISKWLARTNFFFSILATTLATNIISWFSKFYNDKISFLHPPLFSSFSSPSSSSFSSSSFLFLCTNIFYFCYNDKCFILFSLSCSLLSPLLVLTFDYWYCARYPSYDTSKSDKLGENRQPNRENLKSKIKWSGWEFRTPRAAWL